MPTGVALRDPREQLFAAAERILRTQGAAALTSRAVTDEAGCAKGVLHRHFADFDTFLAELVLARIARIDEQADRLARAAGTGSVTDHLVAILFDVFDPIALSVLGMIIARDGLRARLRAAGVPGVPVLTESATMITGYLRRERELGRLRPDVDPELTALTLIGTVQLIFADPERPPDRAEVGRAVSAIVGGALA
ncbi:MAG TPA: TetR/AcrR family transcriptional regulator, partial [Microlunatus sp.]|nr:TetR/AcrR family transcriptional regulator [Microlunatus sp.]